MTELLTAAQMKATEAAAIASGSVTGLELMERAGQGVVAAIFAEWPRLQATSYRAIVLCGPGNNGGDGFVVARVLQAWGWRVEVFLYGAPEGLPPDARVNHDRWLGLGAVTVLDPAVLKGPQFLHQVQLVVDALFGIGLRRPCDLPLVALQAAPELGDACKIVAIDVPSGLCADSGRVVGSAAVEADLTVTFHSLKPGHLLADGPGMCGRIAVVDLGLSDHRPCAVFAAIPPELVRSVAQPTGLSKRAGHKFGYGHALILSGGVGHGGAARLSARAALRIGAGLVTLACPPAALIENAAHLNAVMLCAVKPAGLARVLSDKRINALCIGPGMGADLAAAMLAIVLGGGGVEPRVTVIDADGLTALAGDAALFAALHPSCLLTPHAGEFARLFPDIAARLDAPATTGPAFSKVDATREAAARAGCVVLFKGPDTVIADPTGRCSINFAAYDRAAPWLATAGSGDVLAGFICGLLARGFAPMQAAETAAWLHVECARSFGPGLIAEDLPEELPAVLRALAV